MEYTPLSSVFTPKIMLIGELSRETGFSRDTIRYYEKIGLLALPRKARRANNYKEYTAVLSARLRAIRELKNIGYTLHEIQQLIEAYETGQLDCEAGKEQLLEKVRLIDKQIRQLQEIKAQLLDVASTCPEACKIIRILHTTLT